MNIFHFLWNSTLSLYKRFGVEDTPVLVRQRIFIEEVLEFIQASTILAAQPPEEQEFGDHCLEDLKPALIGEAADVIVTVQGICMAHGISLAELELAMHDTILKNDAKTKETHGLVKGKITRL